MIQALYFPKTRKEASTKPQVLKLVCGVDFWELDLRHVFSLEMGGLLFGFSYTNHLISNWKGPIQSSCVPLGLLFSLA